MPLNGLQVPPSSLRPANKDIFETDNITANKHFRNCKQKFNPFVLSVFVSGQVESWGRCCSASTFAFEMAKWPGWREKWACPIHWLRWPTWAAGMPQCPLTLPEQMRQRPFSTKQKEERKLDGFVDPRLGNVDNVNEMMQMVVQASDCVLPNPSDRPRMVKRIYLNDQSGDSWRLLAYLLRQIPPKSNSVLRSSRKLPADFQNVPEDRALPVCFEGKDSSDVKPTSDLTTSQGGTTDLASAAPGSVVNIDGNANIPHPQESPYVFSYKQLVDATDNFSSANLVGGGGFGPVYKGTLHDEFIAVKRLDKAGTGQGEREFKAEVEIISRTHHRNVVRLVGYCMEKTETEEADQRLLVYKFLHKQSLDKHLVGETPLDWQTRMKIATGVAQGLAYLHDGCDPRIIHGDIKSPNILLDENFETKVSDFGLARLIPDAFSRVFTQNLKGTRGYLAPEYAMSGQLTEKVDVLSFGVVLLELITGRKPLVDNIKPLDKWAERFILEGELDCLVDKRLKDAYDVKEMKQMVACASACVHSEPSKRPLSGLIDVHYRIDLNQQSGDSCGSTSFYSATTSSQNNSVSGSSTILPADLGNVPEERELP
eukprot:Gb_25427 [translate_table: standard]